MEGDEELINYGDMHKIVLQGIMAAGFLDAKGVKSLFNGACKALNLDPEQRTSMPAVQKVVREINERIKVFDMAIRSASCELTGKKFYVFLVTVEKPIMKLQTLFAKVELDLYQKIMTAALRKYDNFAVPVNDCLNMTREIDARNFSVEMAEQFIHKMIALQYLSKYFPDPKSQEYEVTLGIRAIREFEPVLREVYDDVMTNCNLCKMIMLHGHRCPKSPCNVFVHKACFDKYIKTCKVCPGCKAIWSEKTMVRRVRHVNSEDSQSSTTGGRSSSPKRGHGSKAASTPNISMPVLHPIDGLSSKRKGTGKSASPSPQSSPDKRGKKGRKDKTTVKRKASAIISSTDSDSD